MITQTINLNLIPGSPLPRINVSQYDNGSRTLQFNLYNGVSPYEIPSGASVSIVGTKADNTGFEYACTFDGSLVSVDITDQMTVFAGEVQSELQIRQSDEILGTANFIINVERAALSDDTQISETDIPIIQRIPEILEEAEEYADTAHKWATFGADTETPSSTNNAKYWADQSQVYAAGALHWKSSVTFANIPTSGMIVGDFYNITDDFTTDSRFDEGAGIKCAAGTNIVWDTNNKWDILTPSTVASQVKYDGTTSGLSATNVQGAIDEINNECFRSRSFANETSADNIVKPGFYIVNPNRTTSGLPVSGVYGYLTVLTSNVENNKQNLLQRFELPGSSSSVIYERKCSFDSSTSSYIWYPWKTFLPSGQVIAHHEVSDTASQAYSVGSYLTRGEQLKKVTSAIASGGTISSSNTSNTTVGQELKQLNSDLSNKLDRPDSTSPASSGGGTFTAPFDCVAALNLRIPQDTYVEIWCNYELLWSSVLKASTTVDKFSYTPYFPIKKGDILYTNSITATVYETGWRYYPL